MPFTFPVIREILCDILDFLKLFAKLRKYSRNPVFIRENCGGIRENPFSSNNHMMRGHYPLVELPERTLRYRLIAKPPEPEA